MTRNLAYFNDGRFKKLIATSTEHKIEGVLQYIVIDDEAERLACQYGNIKFPIPYGYVGSANDWLNGYQAAKEKYRFSEEQLWVVWNNLIDTKSLGHIITLSDVLQSLKQSTLPEFVEVEEEEFYIDSSNGMVGDIDKIIRPKLNSQGLIEIHI